MLACGCAWLQSRCAPFSSGRRVASWEVSALENAVFVSPEECGGMERAPLLPSLHPR